MKVLGISCYYHDAAACLVDDGKIVAAAEEERFTRKKHDNCFPQYAIEYCLNAGGTDAATLDLVCFYEKPLLKLERLLYTGSCRPQQVEKLMARQLTQTLHERLFIPDVIRETIGYQGHVAYTDHHLAHAASAYYPSGFGEAAIMTVDGVGEWATTAQYIADGNHITKLREIEYPHSLGLLYSTLTAFLGFKVNNDEYKVMGLASYGTPRHADKIRKLITVFADGSFRLNPEYFSFMYDDKCMYSDEMIALLGRPRLPGDALTAYHKDLASSLQTVLQETMVHLARTLYDICGRTNNLCLAGGVGLNCVANAHILQQTPFKRFFVQPAAGDGGCALGAALYAYYNWQEHKRPAQRHTSLYGPEFSAAEIKDFLQGQQVEFAEFDEEGICRKTAELIAQNQIVGWFQGRMEFGPRALGNRSILANPCNPEMQHILNRRVKFREDFRPFAPAVLAECAGEYFEFAGESPFMLFTANVRPGREKQIPAVTHVDMTARIQTVSGRDNPRFHRLIRYFGELTGVPVVVNTSFNIRGEPIVCSMADAYNCFRKTDIDYLVMGNCLVDKECL